MAKRLTLTEYRQENAIWLSNEYQNLKISYPFYNFILKEYCFYLEVFGIKEDKINELPFNNGYHLYSKVEFLITSEEIEEVLKEDIEHCHH